MFKKHAILLTIILSIILLLIAAMYYPGGSQLNKNSVGYDWKNNYISNLFGEKAVNGAENTSRYWAVAGMLFLSLSFTLFFFEFSKRISHKTAAAIIKYFGVGAMLCTFLAVTPLHDLMITIGSTLVLISIFYITVFVFKSKLNFFKILSVICLLIYYATLFIYKSGYDIEILPVMQKATLIVAIAWMLGLHYSTDAGDFEIKKKTLPVPVENN